jgi:putative ABC transport system permease protein
MFSDLRQAMRQLRKSPGFTATVVITLALGIGATTAIFTLVEQVLLRSLAVTKPEELWRIGDQVHCCNWGGYSQDPDEAPSHWVLFPWEAYKIFRANTPAFSDLAALQAGNTALGVRRAGTNLQAETRNGDFVSGNYFQTFGVSAWRGRLFTDSDDQEGVPPVAVMSFHTWEEKYGADPSVVGSVYEINGHPFTIIGVTPPTFLGAKVAAWGMPDIWMPLTTEPMIDGATERLKDPHVDFLEVIGRVKPGTNPKALEAQLRSELHGWLAGHVPDMNAAEKAVFDKQTLSISPGGAGFSEMRRDYSKGLVLLMITAGCVLLVACANIANLLLARGLRNRQQIALRVALGASRQRLVRQALVESVLLALIGGAAGIAVAYAGARLMLFLAFHSMQGFTWVPVQAQPSTPVLLFALGVSLLTGILFGVVPAWMTSRAEPVEALRGANRSVGGGRHWAQKTLVVAQAAVSLVLLSAAAMLGGSLRNLEHQRFGFDGNGRYLVSINPILSNYKQERLVPLFRELEERLSAIPGVRQVSAATYAPLSGDQWGFGVRFEGRPEPGPKDDLNADWTRVTPGFFETIGAKVLTGRPITEDDNATTRPVAVVNEAFAKKFFGKQSPVGQHFGPSEQQNAGTYEIVGVVSDVHWVDWDFKAPDRPMYYVAEGQTAHFPQQNVQIYEIWSHYLYNIVMWAPGKPPDLQAQVKRALADVDPSLVMYNVQPYSDVIDGTFDQENTIASLTLLFGAIGLALAAIGLYGVTAYTVEQRTSEIGVRMALGADRGQVVQMVLKGAFAQVLIGLALGIPSAIGAGYLIASQLFGVKPWDPLMLAAATLMLGLAALLAAVIPAQRAAGLDPVVALRSE